VISVRLQARRQKSAEGRRFESAGLARICGEGDGSRAEHAPWLAPGSTPSLPISETNSYPQWGTCAAPSNRLPGRSGPWADGQSVRRTACFLTWLGMACPMDSCPGGSDPGPGSFWSQSLTESERVSDPILTCFCYNGVHRREALWRNEFFLLYATGRCESIYPRPFAVEGSVCLRHRTE
jgi:hypothetical protein